jgi:hypothetical protein
VQKFDYEAVFAHGTSSLDPPIYMGLHTDRIHFDIKVFTLTNSDNSLKFPLVVLRTVFQSSRLFCSSEYDKVTDYHILRNR